MNTPTVYTPAELANPIMSSRARLPDGTWVQCRPMGYQGLLLRHRLRCAWMVVTGRWDALRWEGQ